MMGSAFLKDATGPNLKEDIMGLLEEAVGAVAALEGAKKLDPNASLITEGLAAVAGFEGTKVVTEHLEEKKEEEKADQSS